MLSHSAQWQTFLERSYPSNWRDRSFNFGTLWDCVRDPNMTPERLLELIGMTGVDGDSTAQLAIHKIAIESLSKIDTN